VRRGKPIIFSNFNASVELSGEKFTGDITRPHLATFKAAGESAGVPVENFDEDQ